MQCVFQACGLVLQHEGIKPEKVDMIEVLLKWRVATMMYHDLGEAKSLTGADVRLIEHVCKRLAAAASEHASKATADVCNETCLAYLHAHIFFCFFVKKEILQWIEWISCKL